MLPFVALGCLLVATTFPAFLVPVDLLPVYLVYSFFLMLPVTGWGRLRSVKIVVSQRWTMKVVINPLRSCSNAIIPAAWSSLAFYKTFAYLLFKNLLCDHHKCSDLSIKILISNTHFNRGYSFHVICLGREWLSRLSVCPQKGQWLESHICGPLWW